MYQSIHEVPKAWRSVGGYPLSLDQINDIVDKANNRDEVFSTAFGHEREDFKSANKVENDIWIGA